MKVTVQEIKCKTCEMVLSIFHETRCITWYGPCGCVESDPKETHLVTLDTLCVPLTSDET